MMMNRKVLTAFAATVLAAGFLLSAASCKAKEEFKVIDPDSVNGVIAQIDSSLAALKGFEPDEAGFSDGLPASGAYSQATYDSARVTWKEFTRLCAVHKFKKAYELYYAEGRSGDFLVHLKTARNRYVFDSSVLWPLIAEFETDKQVAVKKYIDAVELEYLLESATMATAKGDSDYIPELFPMLVKDLGNLLSISGRLDDALGLVDDYAYAIEGQYGNPAYTTYCTAILTAGFYNSADEYRKAIGALEGYIQYVSAPENRNPGTEPAEYEFYIAEVEKLIAQVRAGMPEGE